MIIASLAHVVGGLVAGVIALYLTIRTAGAFASRTAAGIAAPSLAVLGAAFWVAGLELMAGPIPAMVLAFALIAAVASLRAYWFPPPRPYCVVLAVLSALFVFLFATGLWRPSTAVRPQGNVELTRGGLCVVSVDGTPQDL